MSRNESLEQAEAIGMSFTEVGLRLALKEWDQTWVRVREEKEP